MQVRMCLFAVALGLRCCAPALSGCGKQGLLSVAVRGLLVGVASPVAEHGLSAHKAAVGAARGLSCVAVGPYSAGSEVVHRLSCSSAGGILPDQGLNLCPLPWSPARQSGYPSAGLPGKSKN